MKEKGMPFSFLIGDLPTYKLILELQTENPDKFMNIVPIIGAFHQQTSYIYVIYKLFLVSGISDLLVSASMIMEASYDSWLGCVSKTLQMGIEMHYAMARSSHSQTIEHCSGK